MPPQRLPPELKGLVREVGALVGRVVREAEGEALYRTVETVRRLMVAYRGGRGAPGAGVRGPSERRRLRDPRRDRALSAAARTLGALPPERRLLAARAFTLYLEAVNACENAYRAWRLRSRWRQQPGGPERANVVFVLTAHPTESRSSANIRLLRSVQAELVEALERRGSPDADRVLPLLHLVWRTGTHPAAKPTVEDEAEHLYSMLTDDILEQMLGLEAEGHYLRLRTWVGGDKDGNPHVGAAQTQASLALARRRLLDFALEKLLAPLSDDLRLLDDARVSSALDRARSALGGLRSLRAGDGRRVRAFASELERLRSASVAASGAVHPRLASLSRFLSLFPALVVPLELREEAGAFRPGSPIAGMMRRVAALSRGGEARGYVRGLVVSMVSEAAHLLQAHRLARRCVPEGLPVVPLFERPADLENAPAVLAAAFRDRAFARDARERRHGPPEARGLLEVMVGYSDTAKRMGALASRLAIHDAMLRVGRWAASKRVPLLFFHGAGGSEGRGGGTIEEQAALWPAGSLAQVKVTIQGEMVERTFSTPEILKSQVLHWARVQHAPPKARPPGALTRTLAKLAHEAFADIVQRPSFTELLDRATPYRALGELHIGSRPSRRSPLAEFGDRGSRISGRAGALAEIEGLRAIPWVMCWTQSRLLLPAWLGLGRAWREAGRGVSSKALATALETDPMLRSYLRTLRFALAKEAPRIWLEYVRRLAPGADEALLGSLERERSLALDLARRASGARWVRGPRARGLLPDRPWLAESIFYRAPMIHPLNLLQIGTLSRPRPGPDDLRLLRETVTGIAAGMLTTG